MTKTETVVNGKVTRTEMTSDPHYNRAKITTTLTAHGDLKIASDRRFGGTCVELEKNEVPELVAQLRQLGLLPSPPVSA